MRKAHPWHLIACTGAVLSEWLALTQAESCPALQQHHPQVSLFEEVGRILSTPGLSTTGFYPLAFTQAAARWGCSIHTHTSRKIARSEPRSPTAGGRAISWGKGWTSHSPKKSPAAAWLPRDAAVVMLVPLLLWEPGSSGFNAQLQLGGCHSSFPSRSVPDKNHSPTLLLLLCWTKDTDLLEKEMPCFSCLEKKCHERKGLRGTDPEVRAIPHTPKLQNSSMTALELELQSLLVCAVSFSQNSWYGIVDDFWKPVHFLSVPSNCQYWFCFSASWAI